jgi:hypothetical protein
MSAMRRGLQTSQGRLLAASRRNYSVIERPATIDPKQALTTDSFWAANNALRAKAADDFL